MAEVGGAGRDNAGLPEREPRSVKQRQRNDKFRAARLSVPSPKWDGEGLSRQELADAVNTYLWGKEGRPGAMEAHYIAKIERGAVACPRQHYRTAFRAVLKVASDAELGFHPTGNGTHQLVPRATTAQRGNVSVETEPLPPPVLAALEIVTSGHSDSPGVAADCLQELVHHYSEKLPSAPPLSVYQELSNVRSFADSVLEKSKGSASQRASLVAGIGHLSNLLAVATSYMGDHGASLIWCLDAERRSYTSGDLEIAGWAAFNRAMMAYYQGNNERSVDLAVRGQKVAPKGTVVRARLAAHEMRSYAVVGKEKQMLDAKARATSAIRDLPENVNKSGVFSIALSEDPPYTATSLLLLDRFKEAESATRRVLRSAYPKGSESRKMNSSNYARTLLILGLARAGLGDIDGAVAAGREALGCEHFVWPTFVLAQKLDETLMRQDGSAAEVRDYHDLCQVLGGTLTASGARKA